MKYKAARQLAIGATLIILIVAAGSGFDGTTSLWAQSSVPIPPAVAVDAALVTVNEGETARNSGTASAVATFGQSVGSVRDNADGTWSWEFTTSDGPSQSQPVTITVTSNSGAQDFAYFDLIVENVAPDVGPISAPAAPVSINDQPIIATAVFTDPGVLDTHWAVWSWGDGSTSSGTVDQENSIVGGSHTYSVPGVYAVLLAVTDDDGSVGVSTRGFLVVYDPSGGFVTGGGWIDSPPGAYTPDPSLTGRASFGFVSRYKKGATVPTGNTEFQFHAPDLNFYSSSYDWLMVTGSNFARFKGQGTINGQGAYKFMLWAGDGEPDSLRIRIWEEDEYGVETVIYDNGFYQAIGGGSIVIDQR